MKKLRTSPDSPCIDCGVNPKHSHGRCKPCRNARERDRRKGLIPKPDPEAAKMCIDCGIRPKRPGKRKSYCYECRNKREREAYANTPYEVRTEKQLARFYQNAEKNLARNRENMRKYRADDPEYGKEAFRKYRKDNPLKFKAYQQKRRALELNADGSFTELDWLQIVYKQQSCCMSCGLFCDLHIDHIVPLSRGGSNWPSNLQGLCKSCNSSKGDRLDYQFVIP